MIRCLAVDDEPLALELLEDNIRQIPYLEFTGGCSNALDALKFIQQQPVDLIFLDIQMPGLTGIQFVQSLSTRPMIILVTAYEKFAIESYDLDVVDYLVKPVAFDRFLRACNKALELFELRAKKHQPAGEPPNYFFVNVEYSLDKIDFSDIQWVEGLKDYIKIHLLRGQRPVITRMSMKSVEDQLPAGRFVRIHKSYIVSIAAISS